MSCLATDAIDLSINPSSPIPKQSWKNNPSIFRPTPRPAWSILWYQSLWPTCSNNDHTREDSATGGARQSEHQTEKEYTTVNYQTLTADQRDKLPDPQYKQKPCRSQEDYRGNLKFSISS